MFSSGSVICSVLQSCPQHLIYNLDRSECLFFKLSLNILSNLICFFPEALDYQNKSRPDFIWIKSG